MEPSAVRGDLGFVRPRYGEGCFADLPPAVVRLLTGRGDSDLLEGRYEKVVLFFVDAFGWRFFEPRRGHYEFLRHFDERGSARKITAQFPSTTAAHVTCMQTGLSPAQSGVFEWQYYEPAADVIIKPLLWAPGDSHVRGSLALAPEQILPHGTIYQQLAAAGVQSYVFQPGEHLRSPYSQWTFRGAQLRPYRTLPSALTNLRLLLDDVPGPAYFFIYFDGIDGVGHDHGPASLPIEAEIDSFLRNAEQHFLRQVAGRHEDTLLLVTSDHGMTAVDPATAIYIDEAFPECRRYMRRNQKGAIIAPGGSPRDMFLYIDYGQVEEAREFLATRLEGRAEVRRVDEMLAEGYFGPAPVAEAFPARAGELVILPYAGETIWWWGNGEYEQTFYGNHGGLTADEMETPLLACDLGR